MASNSVPTPSPEEAPRTDFNIPERNMPDLMAQLAKLNARAAKIGAAPITVTETGFEMKEKVSIEPFSGERRTSFYKVIHLHVEGEAPKINGWYFAATIQHDAEVGNILRVAPSFERSLPRKYRTVETLCEHCGYNRVRKDTYILMSEAGEWKQVGRTCLRDFLGHANPLQLASWAETISSLGSFFGGFENDDEDPGWNGGIRSDRFFRTEDVLVAARTLISLNGFMSRKRVMEEGLLNGVPTSHDVADVMCYASKAIDELRHKMSDHAKVNPQLVDEAKAAREWAMNLPETGSDFEWNLRVAATREFSERRDFGLLTALWPCYLRAKEQEAERAERATKAARKPSEHFGTPGKREVFYLRLEGAKELDSQFGVTTLMTFVDANGNRAKWFASGAVMANGYRPSSGDPMRDLLDWTEGGVYQVKATVKAHSEFQGRKETQLTRVTVLDRMADDDWSAKMMPAPAAAGKES